MNTFDTPEPITAVVSFTAADIRISAAQRTDTTVEVRPADPADATDVAAAERARVTYADGRLTVKDRSSIRSLPGRIAVAGAGNVTVDRAADALRVTVEQGVVKVGAIGRGRADLDVGAGTINVGIPDGTAALLDAKTTLGRVRDTLDDNPEESGGNTVELHAHVARGDIQLHRVTSGR
ncbi:hypothetical protein AB0J63_43970 [Streptosporangium canum]|uniref:hypothetical protein n=1 Tax=Streptosporangium canum TaxID=324952 RepID=UPI0034257B42